MNDTIHNPNKRLHLDVVTELLKGLEGEKPIAEVLTSAEKLFIKESNDKVIVRARQQVMTLKQRYSQEKMKDDEAKAEINSILLMLT